jgi:CheY-like chemotaxis protein
MIEYSALIIDDDIWMQRILSKTVASYGFKKSYLANNGIEGIAFAIEHKPHVIFLDIMMPEISGHLVVRILKRIHLTKSIPIFMVSALSDAENLGLTVKYGASGYISKPFTRVTIYEKLLDVFGRQNLELIARGEPIDDSVISSNFENLNNQNLSENEDDNLLKTKYSLTDDLDNTITKDNKKSINPNKIATHYQEDEKKNLEAIRKMLLKK